MKKVLINVVIILGFFLTLDKVKASTDNNNIVYFNLDNSKFTSVYNELKPNLDKLKEVLSNNPKGYKWTIYIGKESTGNFISLNVMPSTMPDLATSKGSYCFVGATYTERWDGVKIYSNTGGCLTLNNIAYLKYNYKPGLSNSSKGYYTDFNSLLSDLSSDMSKDMSSSSNGLYSAGSSQISVESSKFNFTNNQFDYFNNNSYFVLPYAAFNINIHNFDYQSSLTYYKVKIGNNELSVGTSLESDDNYLGSKVYKYDEYINDIDYSRMILDFDVEAIRSRNNVFDGLYDISTDGALNEDGEIYTDAHPDFSEPYLEYELSDGIKKVIKIFNYEDEKVMRSYWYGTYLNEVNSDIQSMRLVIPMYDTSYVRYLVRIVTYIPFTVSYEYDDFSYIETIDLSNKYGVMFMPKLVSTGSYISTLFNTRGIDSILLYETYDYKQAPLKIYSSNITNFTYTFNYEDLEYNLFFKVKDNVKNALVDYDTRYFTYHIVDTKYSLGYISNPNTGEYHNIDFSNTDNIKINFDSIGDVFYFISEKIDLSTDSYILFRKSLETFFDTMPTDIYILILTLLAVILIGTTLALGGWK